MNQADEDKTETVIQNNNEYLICFKNIIHSLKICAIFPFINFNEETKFGQLVSKIITVISLTLYLVVNIKEGVLFYNSYFNVLRDFNFINLMRYSLQAGIRLLILVYPFLTWNKNEKLRNHWQSWMNFQIEMEKLTKIPFKSSTQFLIQGLFLLTTFSMVSICILAAVQQRPSSLIIVNPFTILYIFTAHTYATVYWMVNNIYITGVAHKLTKLVRRTIHDDKVADMDNLIHLWLLLCDLNDEFIDIHSVTFLLLFSAGVVVGVLCVFLGASAFFYLNDRNLAMTYFYATSICIVGLMIFCESANAVIRQMERGLKAVLLRRNIHEKKNFLPVILLFLYIIETRKPKVTFNGYMTIDRSTASPIIGAAINFLLVLKQFSPT